MLNKERKQNKRSLGYFGSDDPLKMAITLSKARLEIENHIANKASHADLSQEALALDGHRFPTESCYLCQVDDRLVRT